MHKIRFLTCIFSFFIFFLYEMGNISFNDIINNDKKKDHNGQSLTGPLNILENSRFIIKDVIDLKGEKILLPKSVSLIFKGGYICNGVLIGNETKIECGNNPIFDNVKIGGSWNVPKIKTSMFSDIRNINSLQNVIALTNPNVSNIVHIEKGDYQVEVKKNNEVCLPICSNTTLIVDGTIRLSPNDFPRYDIIRVKGENIVIKGSGAIIGDKHTHKGKEGQWGMGIRFHEAFNASVIGLRIRDCWGDCIYVGGASKNVRILKCNLEHGRRQGISVTKADSVVILECVIKNVSGHNPEYAIDVEPNQNDTVDNVIIEKVEIIGCKGGLLSTIEFMNEHKIESYIGSVVVKKCKISGTEKIPIYFRRCNKAIIKRCTIRSTNDKPSIFASEINEVTVKDNTINVDKRLFPSLMNKVKEIIGINNYHPIRVSYCKCPIVSRNRIVEK